MMRAEPEISHNPTGTLGQARSSKSIPEEAKVLEMPGASHPNATTKKTNPLAPVRMIAAAICAPFKVLKFTVDLALSLLVLATLGAAAAWATGIIPQEEAAKHLTELGDRGLELIRLLGLSI